MEPATSDSQLQHELQQKNLQLEMIAVINDKVNRKNEKLHDTIESLCHGFSLVTQRICDFETNALNMAKQAKALKDTVAEILSNSTESITMPLTFEGPNDPSIQLADMRENGDGRVEVVERDEAANEVPPNETNSAETVSNANNTDENPNETLVNVSQDNQDVEDREKSKEMNSDNGPLDDDSVEVIPDNSPLDVDPMIDSGKNGVMTDESTRPNDSDANRSQNDSVMEPVQNDSMITPKGQKRKASLNDSDVEIQPMRITRSMLKDKSAESQRSRRSQGLSSSPSPSSSQKTPKLVRFNLPDETPSRTRSGRKSAGKLNRRRSTTLT